KMALRGKRLGLSLAEIKDLIGMYASTEDETPQLLECLRVMSKRRDALEQQREDIEAMLAEITLFEQQCQQELVRRESR
ncbi:MAG: MerR family DNA-binding protein, partial [Azonexus sp.]